jgi:Domain of unknown function (DUF4167)
MKHTPNPRRLRSRGNGKRNPGPRNQTFESNGPEVKVRGTAQQVLEKYLALARDAYSSGDPIAAEGFFQHAEHYHRVLNADGYGGERSDRQRQPPNGGADVAVEDGDMPPKTSSDEETEAAPY